MLHFFSVDDLSGSLLVAGQLQNKLRGVRDSTTTKLNGFMRRRLDAETGIVEYFDAPKLNWGQAHTSYLLKKNISNFSLWYSRQRLWDTTTLVNTDCYDLDPIEGKLTIYGPVHQWPNAYKLSYDGGYPAKQDDAEVMDCPYDLYYQALQQGIFDGRRQLSNDQGVSTDDDKKTKIVLVGGLLIDVAQAFRQYRRILGG